MKEPKDSLDYWFLFKSSEDEFMNLWKQFIFCYDSPLLVLKYFVTCFIKKKSSNQLGEETYTC